MLVSICNENNLFPFKSTITRVSRTSLAYGTYEPKGQWNSETHKNHSRISVEYRVGVSQFPFVILLGLSSAETEQSFSLPNDLRFGELSSFHFMTLCVFCVVQMYQIRQSKKISQK